MSNDPTLSYANRKYSAVPKAERTGVALCLSGGGFRAALYHLGAIRRLNELGILSHIDTVSSVSGGSIIAAHMALTLPWETGGTLPPEKFDAVFANPFRAFCQRNIRTRSFLLGRIPRALGMLRDEVDFLAIEYEKLLGSVPLSALPQRPRFVFCATDLAFASYWGFERARIGSLAAGYIEPPPAEVRLAQAVAASSCFPPVFRPMRLRFDPSLYGQGRFPLGETRDTCLRGMSVNDGGNFDNFGLDLVWKTHRTLLVSDGGRVIDPMPAGNWQWRVSRYTAVISEQAHALRKRWLITNLLTERLEGAYWGITSARDSYGVPDSGYSKSLAKNLIGKIRTDLDAFSDAEMQVLENHGYLLADAALRKHAARTFRLPPPDADVTPPFPELLDEDRVRHELRDSGKVALFGRTAPKPRQRPASPMAPAAPSPSTPVGAGSR